MAPKTPETHKTKLQSLVAQKQQPHKNGLQNTCHLLLCDNLPLKHTIQEGNPFPSKHNNQDGNPLCLFNPATKKGENNSSVISC